MTIKELYTEAIKLESELGGDSLTTLIEFLIFEKKVLQWTDDVREMDLYFKPNNKPRMNKLLLEYKERKS